MSPSRHPDVLVVGGGLIGLACARELALAGLAVELVEASGSPASEASAAAAGMLAPLAEAPQASPFFDACRASRDLWRSWHQEIEEESGLPTGYDDSGSLMISVGPEEESAALRLADAARELGEPAQPLDLADARALVPDLSEQMRAVHLLPNEHRVDNVLAGRALAAAATSRGVVVTTGQPVARLEQTPSSIRAIGDGWSREASYVVLAAGAWSGTLAGPPPVPVRPVRGQMLSLSGIDWPWTGTVRGPDLYCVRRDDRLVVGATVEEAGFDKSVTVSGQSQLMTALREALPGLASATLGRSWAGLRPGTPDDQPILGSPAGWPRLLVASGHYRNGILLAPWTGRQIRELVCTGTLPKAARAFDVRRFSLAPCTT